MLNRALLAALISSFLTPAAAYDWKALRPEGHVSDFASVLDPAGKAELERYCAGVQRATGAEIALVTLRSLEDEPIEDVANTLFRAWGIGEKGEKNGILLLLAVAERRSRLEVGYGLEPIIPDAFAGVLLREMRPALRQGNYPDALGIAARAIGSKIAQAKGVRLDVPAPRPVNRAPQPGRIPLLPLLGLGFFLLLGLSAARRGRGRRSGGFWPGFLLGNIAGGAWHSGSSRGGFGGYDSGDSFGGFGGGDSGGGGASSDW